MPRQIPIRASEKIDFRCYPEVKARVKANADAKKNKPDQNTFRGFGFFIGQKKHLFNPRFQCQLSVKTSLASLVKRLLIV
jgi:hypothetical protein